MATSARRSDTIDVKYFTTDGGLSHIEQFIKSVKAKATEQLLAVEKTVIRKVKDNVTKQVTEVEEVIRLDPAVAAAIADAASPVASVAKRKIPAAIRGRVSTVAKALEGRLSNFATGQQGYTDLAQDLETTLEKDFGRAAKRIEKAGGTAPALQVDDVILQQAQQTAPPRGKIIEALEEEDGETLGIRRLEKFGSEGQYGPVHDWAADPEGAAVAAAIDTRGRPDLQSWIRDRRAAFEAVVERYFGEELTARQAELGLHLGIGQ